MNESLAKIYVAIVLVGSVGVAHGVSYSWNGGALDRGWFDSDNTANHVDGSWWKGDNSWCAAVGDPNTTYDNSTILTFNGGVNSVLSSDISNVKGRLFISAGVWGGNENTLTINEGAKINGLGVCVSGPSSWGPDSGNLIINGGDLTFGGGSGSFIYGLQIGYSKKENAIGTLKVNGGKISVTSGSFSAGTCKGSAGSILINDGSFESKVGLNLGVDAAEADMADVNNNPNDYGRYEQNGGDVNISADSVNIFTGGSMDIKGGTFKAKNIKMYKGGYFRLAIPLEAGDIGRIDFGSVYDHNVPSLTNKLEISKDGSLTMQGSSGMVLGSYKAIVQHFHVKGGAYTNLTSMTIGSKLALIEVSDGGVFYVSHNGGSYGNLTPGVNPYYLRIKGDVEVSAGCYAAKSSDSFVHVNNCIYEHVIDEHGTSPIVSRNYSGGGTTLSGEIVPGNHRIRPEGGVQIISTDRFTLFNSKNVETPVLSDTIFTSAPDATLWTSGKLSNGCWGAMLNTEAGISLERESYASYVYKSQQFTARPMGYCELPKMRTEKLRGDLTVRLKIAAPEGLTQEQALSNVKYGLECAGYKNVAIDSDAAAVDFKMSKSRIADNSGVQKLLLDFTETPMPVAGMVSGKTSPHYEYPTVTNALFTAVSVSYDRPIEGLSVVIR